MARNDNNLIPNSARTPEELKEITRKGGIASGKARREKKLMSEIYAAFLEKEHDVIGKDGNIKQLSGQALLNSVMAKVLSRGDSAAVSLMRELREGTEGQRLRVVNVQEKVADDLLTAYESIDEGNEKAD